MPEWLRRYAAPREGWLALALLVVMLLSLGWSVQRTGWIDDTEFLATADRANGLPQIRIGGVDGAAHDDGNNVTIAP